MERPGEAFEKRVFGAVTQLLTSGQLGIVPACCSVFRGKGYYSRDRKRAIHVDISIEVRRPGAKQLTLLWVWECKDYSSPVPPGDIEEFVAKLNQIAGKNVKGAVVSSGGFVASALNYAKAQGLAVATLRPIGNGSTTLKTILHSQSKAARICGGGARVVEYCDYPLVTEMTVAEQVEDVSQFICRYESRAQSPSEGSWTGWGTMLRSGLPTYLVSGDPAQ